MKVINQRSFIVYEQPALATKLMNVPDFSDLQLRPFTLSISVGVGQTAGLCACPFAAMLLGAARCGGGGIVAVSGSNAANCNPARHGRLASQAAG